MFAFTNYGNCHKIDISESKLECKLTESGMTLKELSKDAQMGERAVALFEVGEKMPVGSLLFFTKKGMIKKSEWSEYEQRKQSFTAVKLGEEDEVIGVEEDTNEEDTIMLVTGQGIGLNTLKDDIPTQGRVATGVRGIALRENDEVVYAHQINEDGEIVIATDESKFKRVIVSQVEKLKRNRKGAMVVSLKEGASVICASYVTEPYMLAVVDKDGVVSELSSERIAVLSQSNTARPVAGYKLGTVEKVIALPYKKEE